MSQHSPETLLLVEHRFVCSQCGHLSTSLEAALLHQQRHAPSQYEPQYELVALGSDETPAASPALVETSQYQCLECGQLLATPRHLLEHRELHTKLDGDPSAAPSNSSSLTSMIHYECLECKALFNSQDLWLSHRQSHRGAATSGPAQVDLEHSYQKLEDDDDQTSSQTGSQTGATNSVQLLLYECEQCLQLFQSPQDFLDHQAAHLLA
ncbi:ZN574 protein, partial [Rhinopomastus cyanomelas]|nr:ZN574 protein [Rhinopomastus cyanomelas]